jgi:hypothetical protein
MPEFKAQGERPPGPELLAGIGRPDVTMAPGLSFQGNKELLGAKLGEVWSCFFFFFLIVLTLSSSNTRALNFNLFHFDVSVVSWTFTHAILFSIVVFLTDASCGAQIDARPGCQAWASQEIF